MRGLCCTHTCVVPWTCAHRPVHILFGSSLCAKPCSRCWEHSSERKTKLLLPELPTLFHAHRSGPHGALSVQVSAPTRASAQALLTWDSPSHKSLCQRLQASSSQLRAPVLRQCWKLCSQQLCLFHPGPSQDSGWRLTSSNSEAGPHLTQGVLWNEGPRLSTSGLSTRVGGQGRQGLPPGLKPYSRFWINTMGFGCHKNVFLPFA